MAEAEVESLNEKAKVYFEDKDYDNAIKCYTEALELNPNNAKFYCNRSFAYLRKKCYEDALADATKALEVDKNYIKGHYRRGTANMALGNCEAALKDFKTVLNAKPNDKDAKIKYQECKSSVEPIEEAAKLEEGKLNTDAWNARTLVVLQGLPGSCKSHVARAIEKKFEGICPVSVLYAEHHMKPENSVVEGYKILDDLVVAKCSAKGTLVVVVDDANHTKKRQTHLGKIAKQHQLMVVFLEPRTKWKHELPRKLDQKKTQFEAIDVILERTSLPLFFGWILPDSAQDMINQVFMELLKQLEEKREKREKACKSIGVYSREVSVYEKYFQSEDSLHCTTKFCDYGKAEGAKEYAEQEAVTRLYGSTSELRIEALHITRRGTVVARVNLSKQQVTLWPKDNSTLAYVTLGCANEEEEPAETANDLLAMQDAKTWGQIYAHQHRNVMPLDGRKHLRPKYPSDDSDLGYLDHYPEDGWRLCLHNPIFVPVIFTSVYKTKKFDQAIKKKTGFFS